MGYSNYFIVDQIFETLDYVQHMWDEQRLMSYRVVFQMRTGVGERGWELACPENHADEVHIDRDEVAKHRYGNNLLWRGYSQSYYLITILFANLPGHRKKYIMYEMARKAASYVRWRDRVLFLDKQRKVIPPEKIMERLSQCFR